MGSSLPEPALHAACHRLHAKLILLVTNSYRLRSTCQRACGTMCMHQHLDSQSIQDMSTP